jgi:hypothetical protein
MANTNSMTDLELIEAFRSAAAKAANSWPTKTIEDNLGLKTGFVLELLDEPDDWAFIIKTSAVVESTLGQVLSGSLLGEGLDRHIRALPMDGRTGKIQLAQDLSLIGPKSAKRLQAICQVRNNFAHGLKSLKLSVASFFSHMPESERDSLVQQFLSSDSTKPSHHKPEKPKRQSEADGLFNSDWGKTGKYVFWTGACLALTELSILQRNIDADRTWRSALMTLGHAFLARQRGDESDVRRLARDALNTLEKAVGSRQQEVGDST